jgi:hypothetical protein
MDSSLHSEWIHHILLSTRTMQHVALVVITATVLAGGPATGLDLAKVCALDLSSCSVHCADGTQSG